MQCSRRGLQGQGRSIQRSCPAATLQPGLQVQASRPQKLPRIGSYTQGDCQPYDGGIEPYARARDVC